MLQYFDRAIGNLIMIILTVGIVIFFAVHAIPISQSARTSLVSRLGENRFKGVFALFSIAGFAAIIISMKNAPFSPVWNPPSWSVGAANLLMPVAFCLLVAAYVPNNFRHVIRNPMLAATLLWALTHLLSNGDLASIMLFASFGIFAIVDMVSVNKRADKPTMSRKSLYFDVLTIGIGLTTFWTVRYFHGAIFGAPIAY
jgi:uncharacterized membrane protein